MELVVQLRPRYIGGELLQRIEIRTALDRSLYLPFYLVPGIVGLDRECQDRAVADEDGVQLISVVVLQYLVQIPAAFGRADALGIPVGAVAVVMHVVLRTVVEQEQRVLLRREVIADRVEIGLAFADTKGVSREYFLRRGNDMRTVCYFAG